MANKKTTIGEFNKEYFNRWKKLIAIKPHFTEWCDFEDGEGIKTTWHEIDRIDMEFSDGGKLSIIPGANMETDNLCTCLKIVEFKAEEINWRIPK